MNIDIEMDAIRNEFIDESIDGLSGASDAVVSFEHSPSDKELLSGIFRTVHSIKGNAAFFELMALKNLAHRLEDVLNGIRNDKVRPGAQTVNIILEAIDALMSLLNRVREGAPEVDDAAAMASLTERLDKAARGEADASNYIRHISGLLSSMAQLPSVIESNEAQSILKEIVEVINEIRADGVKSVPIELGEIFDIESPAPAAAPISSGTSDPESESRVDPSKQVHKTMRIREESIDGFFKYVGELVVVGEMYEHLYSRLLNGQVEGTAVQLKRANESFRTLSMGLQKSIMEIRKVPAKQLLSRVQRLIRDVASKTDKQVNVVIKGEELQIDKAVAETLDAPMVHIVRNAVDHGIESTKERVRAGKPAEGTVTAAVSIQGEMISLTVTDDGKGLDEEKLCAKAVSIGLIDAGQTLTQADIVNLLFASGVSTADEVTDISGRGVGMDVVKRSIEAAGGLISVESDQGKGSRFTLKVPATVTTRIIQGIGVIADGLRYIFPVESVKRFFEFTSYEIHAAAGAAAVIQLDETTLPFARLGDIMGTSSAHDSLTRDAGIGVLVAKGSRQIAVQVDEVEANRQLVVKEMEGLDVNNRLFKGAAITGDGTVSLVIDGSELISSVSPG